MKIVLLLSFALSIVSVGFAQELDELKIGMPEADAVSVFTRYRSCENAVHLETPGELA